MKNHGRSVDRWGGGLLALGCLALFIAGVTYMAVYGRPEGTGPEGAILLADRVAHLEARWTVARNMWLVEMVALILLAIASFVLQRRSVPRSSGPPLEFAWATLGVAAVFHFPMYALMLAGYPAAMAVFATEPGLMTVVDDLANFVFHAGSAVLFVGLASVLYTESRSPRVVPNLFGIAGVALGLAGLVGVVGLAVGSATLPLVGIGFLLLVLLCGWLGLRLWQNGGQRAAES